MNNMRLLYHLARADFWERVRRYSFLITLGLTVYLSYTFLPSADASYRTVALGDYRGVYNSAWVGSSMAIMSSVFLSFFGFYLVKNAVERDDRTGVGQILATTPLTRPLYTLGKTLSNFAVLGTMIAIVAVVAIAMQLIRGEELRVDIWPLLSPFILLTLPAMAIVAALAVLFETIPRLRGGLGNVVFYFLWNLILVAVVVPQVKGEQKWTGLQIQDLFGITIPLNSMSAAAKTAFSDYDGSLSVGYNFDASGTRMRPQTFVWPGIEWTPVLIAARLVWVAVAFGLTLLSATFFRRFDTSYEKRKHPDDLSEAIPDVIISPPPSAVHLTPLSVAAGRFNFFKRVLAEMRLMLKGQKWWWFGIAAGLIVGGLVAPPKIARGILLPAAWIWPLLIWSGMGCREIRFNTAQLVFSSAHPLRRQVTAIWLAGVVVTILAGSGVATRLLISGDVFGLAQWTAGALFTPSLALALGTLSGGSKLFEVIYTILWYVGPVNRLALLDFMGANYDTTGAGIALTVWAGTLALLSLTILSRKISPVYRN